jgi:geranylgeranylglycerol-phosphate geranylgeranyltransferase
MPLMPLPNVAAATTRPATSPPVRTIHQHQLLPHPPAAASASSSSSSNSHNSNVDAYLQLARVHNVFPSVLLAMVGGAAAARSVTTALLSPAVWAAAAASAGVALASMAVNDYFDRAVDRLNRPDKPIPSGRVPADGAVLLAACLYIAVLAAACFLDPLALRAVIAFSSTVTMLYTPFLKKVPVVKNVTVAAVIALAPIAGALAVSGGGAGGAVAAAGAEAVRRLLPCAAFAFFGVVYREILMDVHDMDGDLVEGVVTVPALIGRGGALVAALASLAAGTASALCLLYGVFGGGVGGGSTGGILFELPAATATSLGIFTGPVLELAVVLPAALLLLLGGQCAALAVGAARSGWQPKRVDHAVMACLRPLGLGIMMLAAVAAFGA